MTTQGNKSNYITEVRQAATALLEAVDKLNALKSSWNAGMSTWLADADFVGENTGLTKAQITAVIGTTLDAQNALLATGHNTNLETIRL